MTKHERTEQRSSDADFTAFVRARGTALLRTAYVLTGDQGHAEDLLQAALTKVYLAWGRIHEPQAAEAYARRTIATTAISLWRRPSWRRERTVGEMPEVVTTDPSLTVDDLDEIWRAVATLSPRQRAVITLRYFDDLTEPETARLLGLSVGAVKSHGHRAIAALRERLAEPPVAADTIAGGTA